MKNLSLTLFAVLFVLACSCLAEEIVTPDHLTEKAESDAVKVGVVEFVVVGGEATESEKANAEEIEEIEVIEEEEEDAFTSPYLAGPAEILASLTIPLSFTGVGAGAGLLPATENYLGMAVTPFTTIAGTGVGAVCGALFAPYVLLKGVFDCFTLGAFADDTFDVIDTTDVVEDKVYFVNDLVLLNDPFESAEEIEDEGEDEPEEEEPNSEEEETEE